MTRHAWPWRHLDDLLVVAAAGAAFGANIVGLWIGVGVGWVVAAFALLVVSLLIVQYARHSRRETLTVVVGAGAITVDGNVVELQHQLATVTIPDPRA